MERFAFSLPPEWKATGAGQHQHGEARITLTPLGALPDDVAGFMAAALPGGEQRRLPLASGWPAVTAHAAAGAVERLLVVVHLLDRGVIARLDAPAEAFAAARAQLVEALGRATVEWGAPPFFTLAELLDGVPR